MYSCTVSTPSSRVGHISTRDVLADFERITRQPEFRGWHIGTDANAPTPPHSVHYREGESHQAGVSYNADNVLITGPWSSMQRGETLLYAGLPFRELQEQQEGYATAHAACVAFPWGAVLLLGTSGSGKTVTALQLCRRYGGKLVGNDTVSIGIDPTTGALMARGGSRFVYLRHASIRRSLPELLDHFPTGEGDPWLNKVKVDPRQLGISIEYRPVPIVAAYVVHVDDTQPKLHVNEANGLATRLYLHENLGRYIRGVCTTLLGTDLEFLGYIPSLDTPTLFAQRVTTIDRLISGPPPLMNISGKVGNVAEYVAT